jgi:hypothetical protein
MWTLTASDRRRLASIGSKEAARRTVRALGTTRLRGPFSWDVIDDEGRRFVAEIRHRIGGLGHDCRTQSAYPVVGNSVLAPGDHRRGGGIIVDTDAVRYKVYWRDDGGTLCWHERHEIAIPRLDYGRRRP